MANVNFAFVRHGYGCHNAARPLYQNGVLNLDKTDVLKIVDPELTPLGVDASLNNGCVIAKILKKLPMITNDSTLDMSPVHIVGCSPLLRSMETAYFMTRNWRDPPKKIYVFPLLREIDEGSDDKYSQKSRREIDIVPSYAMRSIREQKDYLRTLGIREYFDFSFVESDEASRREPGDIREFIKWFSLQNPRGTNINVFVVTHAGVLRDFANQGFANNSGFVVNTTILNDSSVTYNKFVSLDNYLPNFFFSSYSDPEYANSDYFCPSSRCGQLCATVKPNSQEDNKQIKKLVNRGCAAYNENEYL